MLRDERLCDRGAKNEFLFWGVRQSSARGSQVWHDGVSTSLWQ
jgi:hypothetical protein